MIDIVVTFKLTQGQGHGVKGQGQIQLFGKKVLSIKHEWVIWSDWN